MSTSPYDLMKMAVDIVSNSQHPTNKVAATLAGEGFTLSRTNQWPAAIAEKIGTTQKIGNSSGTIHAETACLLAADKPTKGATIFVTDPPCPNCMKNMAEAGIKSLYIDHKGFDKDFATRRGNDFENMSLQICEYAGISIYKIHRKDQRLETIWKAPKDYKPTIQNPITIEPLNNTTSTRLFQELTNAKQKDLIGRPFAAAFLSDKQGNAFFMSTTRHPVIGYNAETLDTPKGKYDVFLQPISGLLMSAARKGLKIQPDHLFSSITPTSRELVNMIGAKLTTLTISDQTKSRDKFGPEALKQLKNAEIIETML